MKTIEFSLFACYGYGCCGGTYSSLEKQSIQVSDEAAETIRTLLDSFKDSKVKLDEVAFLEAIESGHTELQPALEALKDKHKDMVIRYWLFEADNDCIFDSLEPYFWEDIDNGLYKPGKTLKQFAANPNDDEENPDCENEEDELADEKSLCYAYFSRYRNEYLKWVNGNDDYWFIAKRTGWDLVAILDDMPDLEFVISKLK